MSNPIEIVTTSAMKRVGNLNSRKIKKELHSNRDIITRSAMKRKNTKQRCDINLHYKLKNYNKNANSTLNIDDELKTKIANSKDSTHDSLKVDITYT